MSDQRYDEQQIGAILQRAAEIQSGLAPEVDAHGLTLPELQKVASEVGIEPHLVERAAREVAGGKAPNRPASGMLDQTVPGEITEEQWEDTVMTLRDFVGRPGAATAQGSTREWTGGWDIGHITLTASSRNGQTRFRMQQDVTGFGVVAWLISCTIGFFIFLGAVVAIKKAGVGVMEALMVGLLAEAVLAYVTHMLVRRWRGSMTKKIAGLFQTVVAQASQQAPTLSKAAEPAQETTVQQLAQG